MEIETIDMFMIHFIGETDNNKLKVVIVGKMTKDKVKTLSTAPYPTVKPPKQPTTKITMQIKP